MPHVSRKKVDKKVLDEILDFLVIVLTGVNEEKEMKMLLDAFLTSTEKIMLAKRLGVAYMLEEKIPFDEISGTLSVTRPTIDKIRIWLKLEESGYELALKVLRKTKNLEAFKQIFKDVLKRMAKPYSGFMKELG
ncbi:hypothetical protein COT03_00225 [Candidatus Shapirobacteria bacterium CG07_land_8_20_14_0_80_39_18]|uniref:Uncharacterized protein n=1 Tax=Candidatus Shapirobacteria bacterium CG07_land_8_20_14_0_80_39_18 TaxID=1974882 RepID=A0A2M6YS53_9BACT|nr:MAG: hypothetical protein COT03_00225 [Candidatus Shapirobacteria bacterium CG07_land_8_20_14_0_80_39_18]